MARSAKAHWTRMPLAILSLLGAPTIVLACSRDTKTTENQGSPFRPTASILELMDAEVDPAADFLWAAVASISTRAGIEDREPHTAEEWAEVRRKAITLSEATNLLLLPGRRVATGYFPSHGPGELDSTEVQRRIDANHAAFEALAHVLQEASQQALAAIDAKNPADLMQAGGTIDAACEGCHVVFWYPDQSSLLPR
jgi:cytochrome c556